MRDLLWTGPVDGPVLVLAHGAGAAMDSTWMNRFCDLLADRGIRTARFEFPYMAARREGRRLPPPRSDTLIDDYADAVRQVVDEAGGPVVIGGKSMGGRVASMAVDGLADAAGLVCLSYPFHPPAAPDKPRTAHLEVLRTPSLIVQGTRDPFGTPTDVAGYVLSDAIELRWLEDGDHDLAPRARESGFTRVQHLATAADAVSEFVTERV